MLKADSPFRIRNLFFFSVLLHLGIVLVVHNYRNPVLWENGEIAKSLYHGYGFAIGFSFPHELTAWQSPGYPYLIWLVWKIFGGPGPSPLLFISCLQVLAVASTIYPVTWLATRWFGEKAGFVAGLLTIILPLFAWYVTRLHQTAFVLAIHPWMVWAWLTLPQSRGWIRVVQAGCIAGLGGLFQPALLGVSGLIAIYLLWTVVRDRNWTGVRQIFLAGFVTLLMITPWTVRNYEVFHRLVLIKDSFGKEFWVGNNPHATGTDNSVRGRELFWDYPPKCIVLLGHVSEIEMMTAMQKEAKTWAWQHPHQFLKITAKKFVWYWTMSPARLERTVAGGEAIKYGIFEALAWFGSIGLAIVGILRKSWPWEYMVIVLLYLGFYSLLYSLTHVGQVRYRGEMEFIILPGAASGIVLLMASRRLPATRKNAAARAETSLR
jgi:hypothetical protein